MAVEYTWQFNGIKVKPIQDNMTDVVVSYEWRRGALDGEYFVESYGSINLSDPDPNDFKEYNNLTKQDLISWTVSSLTQEVVDNYDASLAAQIENLKTPPLVTKPVPWNI